jgi:hypothetical protein
MPGVYEGTCSHCGQADFETDWSLALYQDDDIVVYLAHPTEDDDIRDHGVTMERAQAEGRIVWADTTVCAACGAVNARQELRPQVVHLSDRVLQVVVCVAVAAGLLSRSFWIGAAVGIVPMLLLPIWARARARRLHRDATERRRQHLAGTNRCKRCGGESLLKLGDYLSSGQKLRCRACGERALELEPSGIS